MQDIRKPYSRLRSNRALSHKVEEFEAHSYDDERDSDAHSVEIPIRGSGRNRRNVDHMDMYPRKAIHKITDYDDDDNEDTRQPRKSSRTSRFQFSLTTVVLSLVAIGLIIGIMLYTFVFDSATVTVTPKYQDLEGLNETIRIHDTRVGAASEGSVAYSTITETQSKSKTLIPSETKKVESKATGVIVIYNNFDTEPQKLIKNTRFEGSNGKIYRINQSITIPGKKGATPGSIEVTVYADSVGPSYNLAMSDFSIPGFKGTPRYDGFYGRSKGAITGGSEGTATAVSIQDVSAAKDELALELAKTVKAKLSEEKREGYTGAYDLIDIAYSDNESELLQGITKTYQVTAVGTLKFIDNATLATALASSQVRDFKDDIVRLDYQDTVTFTSKGTSIGTSTDSSTLIVQGSPRIVWETDIDGLKRILIGKGRDEFKTVMKSVNSIKGAEIKFSPLWLSRFPTDTNKINVIESLPKR